MIEPKGPKPEAGRYPDNPDPHFEQSGDEQPMYATEPEAPSPARGSAGTPGAAYGGGWGEPDPPGRDSRDGADQGSWAGGGRGDAGHPSSGESAEPSVAVDAASTQGQRWSQGAASSEGQGDLRALLAAAEANAKENHEQYLRAMAEMENVRRRAQEDVSKAHKFAIESFAESMLPVRDSLEMALTVEVPSVQNLREGVEATLRQLTSAFERNRVVVLDPLHQKFDPNLHQAISMAPSRDVPANHVVSVLQKGYMINDRILRPALVTVSKPA